MGMVSYYSCSGDLLYEYTSDRVDNCGGIEMMDDMSALWYGVGILFYLGWLWVIFDE